MGWCWCVGIPVPLVEREFQQGVSSSARVEVESHIAENRGNRSKEGKREGEFAGLVAKDTDIV